MPKRLFIGLELPASCRETLAGFDPGLKGVRWLPAEQMHMTRHVASQKFCVGTGKDLAKPPVGQKVVGNHPNTP
jgi:hypothetical protein